MNLLAIDRSTDTLSVAVASGDRFSVRSFCGLDARGADWPVKVRDFLAEHNLEYSALESIVVGMGPGSFAGIRGALAFAQGLAIGIRARREDLAGESIVYGLPSPAAIAIENSVTAVVGDARRGLFWVTVYNSANETGGFKLVAKDDLFSAVPADAAVVTSDGARIGDILSEMFGERYLGSHAPSAGRLAEIALSHPEVLVREPLPVYLSPAVRT